MVSQVSLGVFYLVAKKKSRISFRDFSTSLFFEAKLINTVLTAFHFSLESKVEFISRRQKKVSNFHLHCFDFVRKKTLKESAKV